MSEIYHQFVTDGSSPITINNYGIFPSMLKNHRYVRDGLRGFQPIMPPISDGWFLTNQNIQFRGKKVIELWPERNPVYSHLAKLGIAGYTAVEPYYADFTREALKGHEGQIKVCQLMVYHIYSLNLMTLLLL